MKNIMIGILILIVLWMVRLEIKLNKGDIPLNSITAGNRRFRAEKMENLGVGNHFIVFKEEFHD